MTETRPRIYIETYGCQMNEADTQMIVGMLGEVGWNVIDEPSTADVILLNTCAVRERAEERVAGRVRHLARLKRYRPDLRIGLAGCMAKHLGDKLFDELHDLDLLVGPDSYRRLAEILAYSDSGPWVDLALDRKEVYEGVEPAESGRLHAWIPVMRGCDRFCTFCIVPHVRGREKSLPAGELLSQITRLAETGTRAVTLLGQTVNSYHDGRTDFVRLLDSVASIPGLARIRYTSPHPAEFVPEVFAVMAAHQNLCKHVHLPLQSGSNRILDLMRRGHTREEFVALVQRIRSMLPGVSLTTDLIAGFPSETSDEFGETLSLMREIEFDAAFLFRYSPRPGTTAHRRLPDDVTDQEKGRRLEEMIALQEEISYRRYASWVGREASVLVEGRSRRDATVARGKSDDFKTVLLPAEGAPDGSLRRVRIARATSHTLIAEGVDAPASEKVGSEGPATTDEALPRR